jgi:hypothetical protein
MAGASTIGALTSGGEGVSSSYGAKVGTGLSTGCGVGDDGSAVGAVVHAVNNKEIRNMKDTIRLMLTPFRSSTFIQQITLYIHIVSMIRRFYHSQNE